MLNVKVENMTSPSGNKVSNQFEIYTKEGTYFQSYDTIIAFKKSVDHGYQVVLDRDSWDYSVTTGKYRNIFLNEGIAETRKKIKDGTYILDDLNS